MTWQEFILQLADIFIWPVIAVFILIYLGEPIKNLVPKAQKLRFKDVELEFEQAIQSAAVQAEEAIPDAQENKKSALMARAKNFPSTVIRDAWREVDDVSEALIKVYQPDIQLNSNDRYKRLEEALEEESLLGIKQRKLFSELRQLRNKVAHAEGFEVNQADAVQYVELCYRMIDYLKQQVATEH